MNPGRYLPGLPQRREGTSASWKGAIFMKLYEIDSQYMEYLYKADSKVLIHNSGNHQRKFIAIKVLINGYKYFVPLSSPDKRDYYNDQDGHKKVQFTRVPTIKRIFNGNQTVE